MIAQSTTPYSQERPAATDERGSRHAALASAVARIRVRQGRVPVEQILLVAAAVLFPLGLVFILLGWDGAAHNGRTYAQIDYLISGGMFGLGLSVAGGFMYFGYWLSRQLNESRRQNALTVQALERLEDLLDFAVNARAGGQPPSVAGGRGAIEGRRPIDVREPVDGREPVDSQARPVDRDGGRLEEDRPTGQVPVVEGGALFATPRGSLLHRAECAVVARRDDLKTVRPGTDGYRYCTMCNAGLPV